MHFRPAYHSSSLMSPTLTREKWLWYQEKDSQRAYVQGCHALSQRVRPGTQRVMHYTETIESGFIIPRLRAPPEPLPSESSHAFREAIPLNRSTVTPNPFGPSDYTGRVEESSMDQPVTAARLERAYDGFERQHINGRVAHRPRRSSARGRGSVLARPWSKPRWQSTGLGRRLSQCDAGAAEWAAQLPSECSCVKIGALRPSVAQVAMSKQHDTEEVK